MTMITTEFITIIGTVVGTGLALGAGLAILMMRRGTRVRANGRWFGWGTIGVGVLTAVMTGLVMQSRNATVELTFETRVATDGSRIVQVLEDRHMLGEIRATDEGASLGGNENTWTTDGLLKKVNEAGSAEVERYLAAHERARGRPPREATTTIEGYVREMHERHGPFYRERKTNEAIGAATLCWIGLVLSSGAWLAARRRARVVSKYP